MKTISSILLSILIVALSSCNNQDEETVKMVETNLFVTIPISAVEMESLKSFETITKKEYAFSGSGDYALNEIVKGSNEINNIKKITLKSGSLLAIPEIQDVAEINSLELHWSVKSFGNMDYKQGGSVDLLSIEHEISEQTLRVNLDQIISNLTDEISGSKTSVRFYISGDASFALNCTANLQLPAVIESVVFTPQFQLF